MNHHEKYNQQKGIVEPSCFDDESIRRAAQLIFLNKTCFNGLFRQNSRGAFNVPHGRYKNPKIADVENIINISRTLKEVKILCGDFAECQKYAAEKSLIYFDPPYRPLGDTANFTSYTKDGFGEQEQIRLAELYRELHQHGCHVILSNSDPANESEHDHFFSQMYSGFNIQRILANRMINCNGAGRGQIYELLITNY